MRVQTPSLAFPHPPAGGELRLPEGIRRLPQVQPALAVHPTHALIRQSGERGFGFLCFLGRCHERPKGWKRPILLLFEVEGESGGGIAHVGVKVGACGQPEVQGTGSQGTPGHGGGTGTYRGIPGQGRDPSGEIG